MLTCMQYTCYQVSCSVSIFAQTNRLLTTKLLEESKLKRELFSTTNSLFRKQNDPKFPKKNVNGCKNWFLFQVEIEKKILMKLLFRSI